jgi:membrane-associated protease RseP (regulator of RpoE activity)
MLRTSLRTAVLIFVFALSACANGYEQFYKPVNSTTLIDVLPATGEPRIIGSQGSLQKDIEAAFSEGYQLVGESNFVGKAADTSGAIRQAKKVGAEVIVIHQKYRNTVTGSIPVTTPTTATAYTSGSVNAFGSGGSSMATYNGSTTVYGSQTTNIPYSVDKYEQVAEFYARIARRGLGIWAGKPTDDQHREMETNQGMAVRAIRKESPAFRADILPGDVILAIDGASISDLATMRAATQQVTGRDAELTLFRKGQRITKIVHVAADTW